jgi:iron complex outermembrane receptor protein
MSTYRTTPRRTGLPAFNRKYPLLYAGLQLALLSFTSGMAYAQETQTLPPIEVKASTDKGSATDPVYKSDTFQSGPLGQKNVMDIPASVTTVREDLMQNMQASTVNDALRYLPSVMIRNQQGYEVSRPQSRGFLGSVFQNTRLDGLAVIGTTAIAGEMLSGVDVLNGVGSGFYGPQTPAGVFNYQTKKPTDVPLRRFTLGYTEKSVWTESADLGGRIGPDGQIGYRLNAVHGEGESFVQGSNVNRNLLSAGFDFHLSPQTVIETNFSYYDTDITGLPGQFNFGKTENIPLPAAQDPTRVGLGQPGAGSDLRTNTGLIKLKHEFNDRWNLEVGALYQDAFRGVYGVTNTMQDNSGNYKVVKNYTSWPHSTMLSNIAYLNGKVDIGGFKNELTFGMNGFQNNIYNYKNNIVVSPIGNPTLNLSNPQILSFPATPATGGEYKQSTATEQSYIVGDTLHLNDKWALQATLNSSDIKVENYDKTGKRTKVTEDNGQLSWSASAIYKPVASLMTYITAASSVEQGESSPNSGVANPNQYLGVYHDRMLEMGAKYSVTPNLILSMAAFHMTRPLASTDPTTNIYEVIGTQTNNGVELFAQGNVTRDLGVFGGITYIDARLNDTGKAATDGKRVVGVPQYKSDLTLDYHPAEWNGFALTGTMHHESKRAAINTNTMFAPSYTTWDAGVRYTMDAGSHHPITARLQVQNLTNKFYYSSLFDGGSNVGASGNNIAYLAPPRTVMATVSFEF